MAKSIEDHTNRDRMLELVMIASLQSELRRQLDSRPVPTNPATQEEIAKHGGEA